MISFLTYDELKCILDHVEDTSDLARCCLVSKALLTAARARLYASISVWIVGYLDHRGSRPVRYGLEPNTALLLSKLRRNPNLVSLVRNVVFVTDHEDDDGEPTPQFPCKPSVLIDGLLRFLTSAKHFRFNNPTPRVLAEMDQAAERHQISNGVRGNPSFSLGRAYPIRDHGDSILRGAYEGFKQTVATSALGSNLPLASLLTRSQDTLRYLSVWLDDDLVLSSFKHFERLRLYSPSDTPKAVTNVFRVLSPLSVIRTLVLVEEITGEASVYLIATGKLATALPPHLVSLSVEYNYKDASPEFVRLFLRALPATSNLKRVNFHNGWDEPKRPGGSQAVLLIGESGERGIRLSFGEKWLIW
ncbi:uncharacterized protein JCM6883_002352 [Sporobolomyces salmoneus]|uniref:uncharacterized protein n=1 Tax=Sporobolomyces salmoneus TaxID=183962 RepID=UPI00317E7A86